MIIITKKRTTKYGEPIRKFEIKGEMKNFVGKSTFAYKSDVVKDKKHRKTMGYFVRITKIKGGWQIWSRNTPKSRKYVKKMWK